MSTENASCPSEKCVTTALPRRVGDLLVRMSAPISAAVVFALAAPVHGQSVAPSIPENAQPKRYGQGWECKPGYRSAGETCDEILVPENAYATDGALGKGWKCMHGLDLSFGNESFSWIGRNQIGHVKCIVGKL